MGRDAMLVHWKRRRRRLLIGAPRRWASGENVPITVNRRDTVSVDGAASGSAAAAFALALVSAFASASVPFVPFVSSIPRTEGGSEGASERASEKREAGSERGFSAAALIYGGTEGRALATPP